MKRHAVDTRPCSSGMENADRIRELLREIRDARGEKVGNAPDAELGTLWPELERRVAQELGRMVDEELALQD